MFDTDGFSQPAADKAVLTAWLFQNRRRQWYVRHGAQPIPCSEPQHGLNGWLLFRDEQLPAEPPSTNPTAHRTTWLDATRPSSWSRDGDSSGRPSVSTAKEPSQTTPTERKVSEEHSSLFGVGTCDLFSDLDAEPRWPNYARQVVQFRSEIRVLSAGRWQSDAVFERGGGRLRNIEGKSDGTGRTADTLR
jgi:hypothetical protein